MIQLYPTTTSNTMIDELKGVALTADGQGLEGMRIFEPVILVESVYL